MTTQERNNYERVKHRDYAIFRLMIASALRLEEVQLLEKKNIDYKNREIYFRQKGGSWGRKRIDLKTVNAIKWYRASAWWNDGNRYMFTSSRKPYGRISKRAICRRLEKYSRVAKIRNVTAHELRRTSANMIMEKTGSIEMASLHLRHSGTDVTKQYYLDLYGKVEKDIVDAVNW